MHRRFSFLIFLTLTIPSCKEERPVYESLDDYPVYLDDDLGVTYSPEASTFKLWSPAADDVRLKLYASDATDAEPTAVIGMHKRNGTWTATREGDLDGTYYTLQIKQSGNWNPEATDPYARAAGANGLRGQVIDLSKTNPEGWANDKKPPLAAPTDAILYELHVRDASLDPRSGITRKGKFLGLTERGTTTPRGDATGLDHILELGVTHVHLLPSFDFLSVDESRPEDPQFNWGYDPQNYNVPEGSYATDARDGRVRVREFKQLVKTFHDAGLRVVMDVVYNHTGKSQDSHFQHLIPDYFYRFRQDGSMSDASACGNEIASERPMVSKYIRESVAYWANEYHIDGFRFDLMGIHDIATMNEISRTLHKIDPTILIYGEGWKAGDSPLPDSLLALKANTPQLDRIAAFSDDVRDGIKGSVFVEDEKGFVSGAKGQDMSIRFGVVASTDHPQVDYDSVNYSNRAWAKEPAQTVNYASCHDNHTLWDRLYSSNKTDAPSTREQMHRLAQTIVLTSQGIPFLHAGTEFCRTKNGDENSYKSGDGVNAIRYSAKRAHRVTYDYVRGLIALRKAHPAFRMGSTERLRTNLTFFDTADSQLVAYRIIDAPGDEWTDIVVVYNGSAKPKRVALPAGNWSLVADGRTVDAQGIGREQSEFTYLKRNAAAILVRR